MYIFVYVITYSILVSADVDKKIISSEEKFDTYRGERIRKFDDSMPKRFLEDMDDYEWHISHLRDAELDSGRRNCKETFETKVKRYKKMQENDASRIQFVSADAIPVDEKDLIPEKCEEIDDVTVNANFSVAPDSGNKTENVKMRVNDTTNEKVEVKNAATTSKVDVTHAKLKKDDKGRRASEYLFSSVEYYDEVPDFDESACPDAVHVIKLEVDALKAYDVECELMLEWQSLT